MPTKNVWIYDIRTNIENINKGNPLTKQLFEDFEAKYLEKPRKEGGRFKVFSIEHIMERNYNLDIFWLEQNNTNSNSAEPSVMVNDIAKNLESALESINFIKYRLEGSPN